MHANQTENEQRPFHAIWLIQITPLDLLMWSHGQMKQSDSEYNAGLPTTHSESIAKYTHNSFFSVLAQDA